MKELQREQKQALALKQLTDDLIQSNIELEQFAYIASHDLQEPLSAINSYLQLFKRKYIGQIDEKADKYIDGTVAGVKRMQVLINDLLSYSRAGTGDMKLELVDFNILITNVLKNLKNTIEETNTEITIEQLPSLEIREVFQNLTSNAIKFINKNPPQIHIAAKELDSGWEFSVKDNGIGIESTYFDKIFEIFQRLHTRQEYAGTGIGLAICKKIIGNHQGQIWVESEIGVGSTFFFIIPKLASYSV